MIESPKTKWLNCELEIDLYQKHTNKSNGRTYYRSDRINKYCSSECHQNHRQKNETRHCENCKILFSVKSHSKKRFCGHYCAGKNLQNCNKVKSWEFKKEKIAQKPILDQKELESRKILAKQQWSKCKKEHKKKRKIRGIERKELLIKECGGKCIICGYSKCSRAMTFHHIDSKNKKFTLDTRNLSQKTWEDIIEEVKKCQLLCFNCHMELHHNQT